ncbi:uncharacterized protein LOC113230864 [Hyposmocoma kahamanoa]|uniref:uncharacterized protein LOC113230864 n=1 Tax=Hyposmocoma kahamanoa TaxID=1477025 RepID=UPI000E6D5B02|nr:uncharacterized protein LOC113230864 [Hyposmocoma kahamanoa]
MCDELRHHIKMEFVSCNNFRIRGDTIPNLNIEEFIKSIENQYDIDMTSPEWRRAITRIQAALIDYIHRIKDHKLRKALILEQLQKEFTYINPFYLADVKARTARKWERLKTRSVIKLDPIVPESIKSFSTKSMERLKTRSVIKLDPIVQENIKSFSSKGIDPEIKEEEVSEMIIPETISPEMIIPEMTIDDVNDNDMKEKVDTFLPRTDNTNVSNEISTTLSVMQTNASNKINTTAPSVLQTNTSYEINITTSKSITNTTTSNSSIRNEVLQLIVKIVERAMDVFVFDRTYLSLKSGETKFVRIYFVQVLHIGCHNCYYDFEFYDSQSNELLFKKTTRVFADVMPHPIQVKPDALNMTDTPIIFGQCRNSFVITNTHCKYPVSIRIVTSTKMKKLIKIVPMETVILQKRSTKFVVKLCTRNRDPVVVKLDEDKCFNEDSLFVQFTLKILISSYVSAFKNITPIFYNIIAPCIHEYEYVYGK